MIKNGGVTNVRLYETSATIDKQYLRATTDANKMYPNHAYNILAAIFVNYVLRFTCLNSNNVLGM